MKQTEVTLNDPEFVDNSLQMEQHLYRKHLHIRHVKVPVGMLIFPITFISFSLEAGNWPVEGTRIAAYLERKEFSSIQFGGVMRQHSNLAGKAVGHRLPFSSAS